MSVSTAYMRERLQGLFLVNHKTKRIVCDIQANLATVSNEFVTELYNDIFKVRKRRVREGLVDTFKGKRHPGKTSRDKMGGCERQRVANRTERGNWSQRPNGGMTASPATRSNANFPFHTCNGKRSQAIRRSKTA